MFPIYLYDIITNSYRLIFSGSSNITGSSNGEYILGFPIPDFDEDGFNLRLLLEHGYLVFLPDIIYDSRGTGISALDCVMSGVNQIKAIRILIKRK